MVSIKGNRIERVIYYVFLYSTFGGMCNYYDLHQHKLVGSRIIFIYSVIVHLSLCMLLPIILLQDFQLWEVEMFARPITSYLNYAMSILNIVASAVSISKQWTQRTLSRDLFNDLNRIRMHAFATFKRGAKHSRKAQNLICFKMIWSTIEIAGTFATIYCQKVNPSISYTMAAAYITVLQGLLHTVENQFCFGMLYTGYLFKLNKYRLSRIVRDMNMLCEYGPQRIVRQKSRSLCQELAQIGILHTNLYKLTIGIKDLYQFQIIVILITTFTVQLSMLFYLYVVLSQVPLDIKGIDFLLATGGAIMSIGDLWIVVYICGDVIKAANMSGEILRTLSSQNIINRKLNERIEMLSFQLMYKKIRLTICGMFDLEWQTGFLFTQASVMYLILLVQLDYTTV